MNHIRVCFLNHDLKEDAGAGRFGISLIGEIQRQYPNVVPLVLTAVGSRHQREVALLHSSILKLLFALPRIRSFLRGADIIHALDGFPYGVIAAIASLGLGKKLVIAAVGTGAIQAFRHPIKAALLRWAYRRADRVVAVSHYTKREILKESPGLDIMVINHAVDASEFSGGEEELSESEKLEIRKLRPYILSVGGGKRRKGYEYSFPAFKEIEKRFPGLRYAVVGHDIENTPAAVLGLTDKVRCFFNIRRPFLRALYRNAELFLLLPFDDRGDVEGFGFAFLEAAAAGLPVVGTYESGSEDAVEHGKNGFLVKPRNSAAAADAAIKILSDRALRGAFSKRSVEFAQRMSWDKVAEKYIEIYKRLKT